MNRNLVTRIFSLVITTTLLWAIAIPAQAQDNLLSNPGFEDGSRTVQGRQPRNVANSWQPWNAPPPSDGATFQNAVPRYLMGSGANAAGVMPRIRSGRDSQIYYSFFETHDGGIYQQISGLTPGTELRFSVYAYIWSSALENTNFSEQPGGVSVQVGIDPTGGTDGLSNDVEYSEFAILGYDTFRQYSIIVEAESSTVTVFIRSRITSPVQNTYIYLDDAVLEITPESLTPTPTNTTEPTATATFTNTPTATATDEPIAATATDETADATATNASGATTGDDPTPTREDNVDLSTATPIGNTATPTSDAPTTTAPTDTNQSPVATSTNTAPISDEFPNQVLHIVQPGDTVSALALRYETTTQAIIAANDLNESALIFRGQGLIIPVRSVPTSTPVPNQPTAAPTATPVPPTPSTYVVQRGDTLTTIATQFSTTVGALVQQNGITNPNRIFAGQELAIPTGSTSPTPVPPTAIPATNAPVATATQFIAPTPIPATAQTYTVQPGDNLFRLALRFNVSLVELAEINGITNFNTIFVGQVLTIPQ